MLFVTMFGTGRNYDIIYSYLEVKFIL